MGTTAPQGLLQAGLHGDGLVLAEVVELNLFGVTP
jgi:hypothetical protein